jgi:hypothetical protein
MKIQTFKNQSCKLHILENLKTKFFNNQRIFFLHSNKKCLRGNHAHKMCTQIFLSLKGNIEMTIENKKGIKKFKLEEFSDPIKVPPLSWVKIKMEKNQLLMVMCNKKFSEKDYIRNYKIFLKKLKI